MGTRYFCDRCDYTTTSRTNLKSLQLKDMEPEDYSSERNYELCSSCYTQIVIFIKNKNIEVRSQ